MSILSEGKEIKCFVDPLKIIFSLDYVPSLVAPKVDSGSPKKVLIIGGLGALLLT